MSVGFGLPSSRLAWHNKGFSDARYHDVKNLPDDPAARESYLKGWRSGNRERLRAQAEGGP